MIWDFWCPACERVKEHWVKDRDEAIYCDEGKDHKARMVRLPGGQKMLYFEEGRARTHYALTDKPITSYKQQRRLMKEHGLVDSGNAPPAKMAREGNAKTQGMKEAIAQQKGRWF